MCIIPEKIKVRSLNFSGAIIGISMVKIDSTDNEVLKKILGD